MRAGPGHRRRVVRGVGLKRVRERAAETVGPGCRVRLRSSGWRVAGERSVDRPNAEAAIRRESDLPLPDGSRIGRGDNVAAAWRAGRAAE